MQQESILATKSIRRLVYKIGLPMVLSMVLQAIYNVVDTAFVINMGEGGTMGNLALTYAFPVQIFMIAIGVGLGIGVNALLSKSLGQKDGLTASKTVGNGIFLAVCAYLAFLLFGIFASKAFISFQAKSIADETMKATVIEMGATYLTICCCASLGQMLFAVYERFLQATGKSMQSMIGQLVGAALNIVLDYVFIYPCGMGVAGAALATVIGQFASFFTLAAFHYLQNKEIKNGFKYLKPDGKIIGSIFVMGVPAMIMQGLLSVMMLGCVALINTVKGDAETITLLQGTFGIYYKIQQIALFACFGMSNALITISSFQCGSKNVERLKETAKEGIIGTFLVSLAITILFEALANPLASLFGLASGESGEAVVELTVKAIRIASIGFLFMSLTIAIQGVMQGSRRVWEPMVLSLLRLVVFLFPLFFAFGQIEPPTDYIWIALPVSEALCAIVGFVLFHFTQKKTIAKITSEAEKESA